MDSSDSLGDSVDSISNGDVAEEAVLRLLFDPELRETAGFAIEPWMLVGDLNQKICRVLKSSAYEGISPTQEQFIIDLRNQGANDEQMRNALRMMSNCPNIQSDAIRETAKNTLSKFIQNNKISRAISQWMTLQSRDDGKLDTYRDRFITDLTEATNFDLATDEFFDFSDPEQIEKARVKDLPDDGRIIKSSCEALNSSNAYGGYKLGDIVMVAAGAGIGKSTFMVQEGCAALAQGFKVLHVFLGDMFEFDAAVKYISRLGDANVRDVAANFRDHYTPKMAETFKNLRVRCYPAGVIEVNELISKIRAVYKEFPYDMLIIDYDANIKDSADSMYESAGVIYVALEAYSRGRCAVIIGSQTKPAFWSEEILPKSSAADSSKKARVVDVMFAIGRNPNCRSLGTGFIAKMRRGMDNVSVRLHLDYEKNRIREISQTEYDRILAQHSDMDGMHQPSPNDTKGGAVNGFSMDFNI